ncbi:hypothetical protein KR093_003182, partial [Drosophila rubida]
LQSCEESNELHLLCGRYCFKALRPILDHTKSLQSEVHHLKHESENVCEFKESEKRIERKLDLQEKNMEQKLNALVNQIKSQDEKVEQKLQAIHKLIEARDSQAGPPYQKIGCKYYYIENSQAVNWFEAVHKCLAMGGHLVSIKNENEFNAIKDNLQTTDYWIDFNDLVNEGEYVSMATGRNPTYFNWHIGEPNNGLFKGNNRTINNGENCGDLWFTNNKHLMNDADCTGNKFFICE